MSTIQRLVGHRAAATIHIETAALHWAEAVRRLRADDPIDAAHHAQIASDNLVFAAHHATEAERNAAAPLPGSIDPANGPYSRMTS